MALKILKETTNNFVFFDIELVCLQKIVDYGEKLNLANKIICKNEDSIAGLKNMVEELTSHDFIHVDPIQSMKKIIMVILILMYSLKQ